MSDRIYTKNVRDDARLRGSFNDLTRTTFGFDFEGWYAGGGWGGHYVPHALVQDGRVVSNVSVNFMRFSLGEETKNYIQLGTVMTAEDCRRQGLNRQIMEAVLAEYAGKCDGVYLFGNDSVVDYYPKFGFVPVKEYEYFLPVADPNLQPYVVEKADPAQLVAYLEKAPANPNDGFYMCENLGLYRFWMQAGFENALYFLPEAGAFVSAEMEDARLLVHGVFGENRVDLRRLACSFGGAKEVVFGFTPEDKTGLSVREYREEDCTLFVLGGDLARIQREKLHFPTFSHA